MTFARGMFVRCNCDYEYPNNPKEFLCGKIKEVDDFRSEASVDFYDFNGISKVYGIQPSQTFSLNDISRCTIRVGAIVLYYKLKHVVLSAFLNDKDNYYYYYIKNENNNILLVCESDIFASFNDNWVNPMNQIKQYEFQNPVFYFGRNKVSKRMETIESTLYGFKELAGCKIFLKAHQLKTVLRCLKESNCRYMIADEVGLGKTIETLSILKIYINNNNNKKIIIITPKNLVDQWKFEAAFKFKIFEGMNVNDNNVIFASVDEISKVLNDKFDFAIIDEVHRLLNDDYGYFAASSMSENIDNILLLSATPIQKRKSEYKKLLALVQPKKYVNMSDEVFNQLVDLQSGITRKTYSILNSVDELQDEIKKNGFVHNDDTEEIFYDIIDDFKKLCKTLNNDIISNLVLNLSYESESFDIEKIQMIISFVCENYQLENCIIRNRRINLDNNNTRDLCDISYGINDNCNNRELNVYKRLSQWIEENKLLETEYKKDIYELVESFFSSANAFFEKLNDLKSYFSIPNELVELSRKWLIEENDIIDNIFDVMDEYDDNQNRITQIINFMDNNSNGKKVLVFTNFEKTFEIYRKIFIEYFGEECCCFFNKKMDRFELESNVYKFQNDKKCLFILSDKSGGEGRNFQNADYIVHIDIPWSANDLEQRIGRLDRIGREDNKSVTSLVCYAKETIENDLFNLWNDGLGIFTKSQSGLEIIMNEVDEKIKNAISLDFSFGLFNVSKEIISLINDMSEAVEKERYFDLASFKYSSMNKKIENALEIFNKEENSMFSEALLSWAALTGFRGTKVLNEVDTIMFRYDSISMGSLRKTMFVPPNFKRLIDNNMNKMLNQIRLIGNKKFKDFGVDYICGTFDRKNALSNDYIHFFAPGDEIFDSIVNNSLNSYKGTCSAFSVKSSIKWKGFIIKWKFGFNNNIAYENNISTNLIRQFSNYLPCSSIITATSPFQTSVTEDEVLAEYKRIMKLDGKKDVNNWGDRGNNKINEFKKRYRSTEYWEQLVNNAFEKSKIRVQNKVGPSIMDSIKQLKLDLATLKGSQEAIKMLYGENYNSEKVKEEINMIEQIIAKPKFIVDSICFIEME